MTDLTSVIERVKKCEGPDRAIDLAIAQALAPDAVVMRRDRVTRMNRPHTHWRYTASVEDVTALIERSGTKFDWSLFWDNGAAIAGCQPASEDGCDMTDTPGATPALALLLAFLKATEANASAPSLL